jgi:tetratricopeptide (TPR) repeat protein
MAEALECYVAARALRSDLGVTLAEALLKQGRVGEGLLLLGRLTVERPDNPWLHLRRGNALSDQKRFQEAEAAFHQTIRLKHDLPEAHYNLGNALAWQGRYQEAESAYHQALRLKPDYFKALTNLGNALAMQKKMEQAKAAFRQALSLARDDPETNYSLGTALLTQGRHQEAEAAFRQALRFRQDFPEAHYNLGIALARQGRIDGAEAAFRAAIGLRHDYPEAHYNLGIILARQGRLQEAEAAYRQTLRFQHDFPEAHCNLGHVLREQGRWAEALRSLRQGHELRTRRPDWPYPSRVWIRQCERLVELDRKLSAILAGETEPGSVRERLELASLCQLPSKRLHRTAAGLYAEALAADPKLAADLREQYRYNAACSAALTASGRAEDARGPLPDKVTDKLRRQALRWLRADLLLYANQAEGDPAARQPVRGRLQHWQKDGDLASVRDPAALAQLPDTEHREWRQFWADVGRLLRKVQGPT